MWRCLPCSDMVSRCGMFCAISTIIERCKTEGVVDVFHVVKALRGQKPGAVRTVVSCDSTPSGWSSVCYSTSLTSLGPVPDNI